MPSGASRHSRRRGAVNVTNAKNITHHYALNTFTGLNENGEHNEPPTPRTRARVSKTRHVPLAEQNKNAQEAKAGRAANKKALENAAEEAAKAARLDALHARKAREAAEAARRKSKLSTVSNSAIGSTVHGGNRENENQNAHRARYLAFERAVAARNAEARSAAEARSRSSSSSRSKTRRNKRRN
jgi:hypothetical protein